MFLSLVNVVYASYGKYDYEQEITISKTLQLQHFADKDYEDEKPVVGIDINRNSNVLNYTLEFTKNAQSRVDAYGNLIDFEGKQIEILGEVYDITRTNNNNKELELMWGALKSTLEEGETATYIIDGNKYEVTALIVDYINNKAKLEVNGEITDLMEKGDLYQLADGVNIGIKQITPILDGDVTIDVVEFYLKTKKILLRNNDEIQIDDAYINNVNVFLTTFERDDGEIELEEIKIEWVAEDDLFLTEDGNKVIMPGLESFRWYMDGFYKGAEEEISVYGSSYDTITLSAPLKDYDVKLDILYDSDNDGNFDYAGASDTKQLITTTCTTPFTIDMDTDEYFVVTKINGKEGETAVLQLSKVHDTNGVTVKGYDGRVIGENKKAGKTFDAAGMNISVIDYSQAGSNATFFISDENCVDNTLVTKEGLQIKLPAKSDISNTPSFVIDIIEEDKDENIGAGVAYQLNATFNSDTEAHVKLVSKAMFSNQKTYSIDDTKRYVGYVESQVSSKIIEDKTNDQYTIEITYPGEETYGNIYLGSKASKVTTNGNSATISTIGDVYKFEKSSDKLNIGEAIANIRTKLSDTHFPIVLNDGTLAIDVDTTPTIIIIINPVEGSTITTNSTLLNVITDEDAVCEYGLGYSIIISAPPCEDGEPCQGGVGGGGASKPQNMSVTGSTKHSQLITGLHNTINNETHTEHYRININCENDLGNITAKSVKFYVNLSDENCTIPTDNMIITKNTTFCQGTYDLPNGIEIGGDNIVLDCDGAVLDGSRLSDSYGIYVFQKSNVKIKNCRTRNYSNGIYLLRSNLNSLENNWIVWSTFSGIDITGSGVPGDDADENYLFNNTLIQNNDGIFLGRSNHNTLINNLVTKNEEAGFRLWDSSYNDFSNNSATDNREAGFVIASGSNYNQFTNNDVAKNSNEGFRIALNSLNNTIEYNNIHINNNYNLKNEQSADISIKNNYWGTTDITEIENKIYDYYDNNRLGVVDYCPYLNAPWPEGISVECVQETIPNLPPQIETISTTPEPIRINDIVEFSVIVSDPNDDDLTFTWYVDGEESESNNPEEEVEEEPKEEVETGEPVEEEPKEEVEDAIVIQESYFKYYANETGEHEIKVVVSDGEFEVNHIWNIDVKESIENEIKAEVENLLYSDLFNSIDNAEMCIIIKEDYDYKFHSYDINIKEGIKKVSISDERYCDGAKDEDFVLSFRDYSLFLEQKQELTLNSFIANNEGIRFYVWPSKFVNKAGKPVVSNEFKEKYCSAVKENLNSISIKLYGLSSCKHIIEPVNETVNVNQNNTEIVIQKNNSLSRIVVPEGIEDVSLNLGALKKVNKSKTNIKLNTSINIKTNLIDINIPKDITLVGDRNWTGILKLPTEKLTQDLALPDAKTGEKISNIEIIEIGDEDISITFDKAIKLVFKGKADSYAGYYDISGVFNEIVSCTANQTGGSNISDGGDCKEILNNDLIIWTKHFTKFVTYTKSPVTNNKGGGGSGSSYTIKNIALTETYTTYSGLREKTKLTFSSNDEQHSLNIYKIDKNNVGFVLRSNPIIFSLNIGEEAIFDIGSYEKLYVRLDDIKSRKAEITLKKVVKKKLEIINIKTQETEMSNNATESIEDKQKSEALLEITSTVVGKGLMPNPIIGIIIILSIVTIGIGGHTMYVRGFNKSEVKPVKNIKLEFEALLNETENVENLAHARKNYLRLYSFYKTILSSSLPNSVKSAYYNRLVALYSKISK